ncbi:MAG: hypothetical protein VB934_05405, partial [Polyangiaceae bacterium]
MGLVEDDFEDAPARDFELERVLRAATVTSVAQTMRACTKAAGSNATRVGACRAAGAMESMMASMGLAEDSAGSVAEEMNLMLEAGAEEQVGRAMAACVGGANGNKAEIVACRESVAKTSMMQAMGMLEADFDDVESTMDMMMRAATADRVAVAMSACTKSAAGDGAKIGSCRSDTARGAMFESMGYVDSDFGGAHELESEIERVLETAAMGSVARSVAACAKAARPPPRPRSSAARPPTRPHMAATAADGAVVEGAVQGMQCESREPADNTKMTASADRIQVAPTSIPERAHLQRSQRTHQQGGSTLGIGLGGRTQVGDTLKMESNLDLNASANIAVVALDMSTSNPPEATDEALEGAATAPSRYDVAVSRLVKVSTTSSSLNVEVGVDGQLGVASGASVAAIRSKAPTCPCASSRDCGNWTKTLGPSEATKSASEAGDGWSESTTVLAHTNANEANTKLNSPSKAVAGFYKTSREANAFISAPSGTGWCKGGRTSMSGLPIVVRSVPAALLCNLLAMDTNMEVSVVEGTKATFVDVSTTGWRHMESANGTTTSFKLFSPTKSADSRAPCRQAISSGLGKTSERTEAERGWRDEIEREVADADADGMFTFINVNFALKRQGGVQDTHLMGTDSAMVKRSADNLVVTTTGMVHVKAPPDVFNKHGIVERVSKIGITACEPASGAEKEKAATGQITEAFGMRSRLLKQGKQVRISDVVELFCRFKPRGGKGAAAALVRESIVELHEELGRLGASLDASAYSGKKDLIRLLSKEVTVQEIKGRSSRDVVVGSGSKIEETKSSAVDVVVGKVEIKGEIHLARKDDGVADEANSDATAAAECADDGRSANQVGRTWGDGDCTRYTSFNFSACTCDPACVVAGTDAGSTARIAFGGTRVARDNKVAEDTLKMTQHEVADGADDMASADWEMACHENMECCTDETEVHQDVCNVDERVKKTRADQDAAKAVCSLFVFAAACAMSHSLRSKGRGSSPTSRASCSRAAGGKFGAIMLWSLLAAPVLATAAWSTAELPSDECAELRSHVLNAPMFQHVDGGRAGVSVVGDTVRRCLADGLDVCAVRRETMAVMFGNDWSSHETEFGSKFPECEIVATSATRQLPRSLAEPERETQQPDPDNQPVDSHSPTSPLPHRHANLHERRSDAIPISSNAVSNNRLWASREDVGDVHRSDMKQLRDDASSHEITDRLTSQVTTGSPATTGAIRDAAGTPLVPTSPTQQGLAHFQAHVDTATHAIAAPSAHARRRLLGIITVTGPCTASGSCFTSPNFPSDYGDSQSCTITANMAGVLSVSVFHTYNSNDKLKVGGTSYSGTSDPNNVAVTAGNQITWSTNSAHTAVGFSICLVLPSCAVANGTEAVSGAACQCGTTTCSSGQYCLGSINSCSSNATSECAV